MSQNLNETSNQVNQNLVIETNRHTVMSQADQQ